MRQVIRGLAALPTWALLSLSLFGCGAKLSETECNALLEHYTDLLVKKHRPEATTEEREQARASARDNANADPAFAECTDEVNREAFECAMAASTPDKLEQCLLL